MVFKHTDLPLPVLPATSVCTSLSIDATLHVAEMSFPRAKVSGDLLFWKLELSKISLRPTVILFLLGTSIPKAFLPGIGTCTLQVLSRAIDKSFILLLTEFTEIPGAICNSYLVNVGPLIALIILVSILKALRVSTISCPFWFI